MRVSVTHNIKHSRSHPPTLQRCSDRVSQSIVEAIWHLEPVFHQDNGDISTDAQTLILSSSFVTVGLIIALVVLFILYYRKRKKYV